MHLGQNVAKLRGLKRLTQKEVAAKLNLTQPEYSRIEQNMVIEDVMLNRIAEAIGIEVETIKNLDDQGAINIISSTLHDNANSFNSYPIFNFNPIDKVVELYDKLLNDKEELLRQKDAIIDMQKDVIEMHKKEQKER